MTDMTQEVWITIRFKGELPAALDAQQAADKLAETLADAINESDAVPTDFHCSHSVEVIAVEEEAEIYETEGAPA